MPREAPTAGARASDYLKRPRPGTVILGGGCLGRVRVDRADATGERLTVTPLEGARTGVPQEIRRAPAGAWIRADPPEGVAHHSPGAA